MRKFFRKRKDPFVSENGCLRVRKDGTIELIMSEFCKTEGFRKSLEGIERIRLQQAAKSPIIKATRVQ